MCIGCWNDQGRPFKITDAVRNWAPKFEDADHWGALHIVVEDWNLHDCDLQFCRGLGYVTGPEIELIDALQRMTLEERWATAILGQQPDFDPSTYMG